MGKWYKPKTWFDEGKKLVKSMAQPVVDTVRSVGHTLEAGYDVMKGDFKEAGRDIAKATGEITAAGAGDMMLGLGGVVAPKLMKSAKEFGDMVGNYSTFNFNAGSQNLENLTGWDIDNSTAEAAEAAAKAEYQAKVDEANAASQRNLRANLLSLRKNLQKSYSRSSQGGPATGNEKNTGVGGIILG